MPAKIISGGLIFVKFKIKNVTIIKEIGITSNPIGFINKINRRLIKWTPEFIRLHLMEKIYRKEVSVN